MPAAAVVKRSSEGDDGGEGGAGVSQQEASSAPGPERPPPPLPPSVKVPRELLRSFPHSKRVGSYLVGKMINKGSFAKVMEGLHIGTGEKVCAGHEPTAITARCLVPTEVNEFLFTVEQWSALSPHSEEVPGVSGPGSLQVLRLPPTSYSERAGINWRL